MICGEVVNNWSPCCDIIGNSNLRFMQTGLVLGVYTSNNDAKDDTDHLKFTPSAQKLNETTNGTLLDCIKL
jgi:hypothetical protein